MKEFEEGFQALKEIKSKWDEGKKLSVMVISNDQGKVYSMLQLKFLSSVILLNSR